MRCFLNREWWASKLFALAFRIGGAGELERSYHRFRKAGVSQEGAAIERQRELLDMVEKAKDDGRFGHEPF